MTSAELRAHLAQRVDNSSLAMFRVLFGAVLVFSVARYFAYGWIEPMFVAPRFHFTYFGFRWIAPIGQDAMVLVFAALLLAAACITVGLFYRVATVVFFALFNYVHLIDVTNYLNHYYLVALLSLFLCLLPLHRRYSIDAWREPSVRAETAPRWMLYLLRFQVGVVYTFAALAKLGPDWLLHGQPLGIWLHARTDTPLIGPLLDEPIVALAMSWAGFLYDLTIVYWLMWRRSRPFAFAVVCTFHFLTAVFFDIGIFPLVMTVAATLFFAPDWPRRFARRAREVRTNHETVPDEPRRLPRWGLAALALFALVQLAFPLRAHLYGGDVLWHEQGMRWSWRVMVREKNGEVMYRVRTDGSDRERRIAPREYLTFDQEREFGGEPDLILQLAHRIERDLSAAGHRDVEVRADAWVSLNGRPSARLIDPEVDLTEVDDTLARARWILPAPDGPPLRQRSRYLPLAAR